MNTFRNPYIGHASQLLRINDYTSVGGFADGARSTDIQNGPLSLTVSADRGMDFPYLSYKGMNMGYIAPCGLVGSSYYDDKGMGFLRGFTAGFLTTCGLTHFGAPSDVDGKHYGMHGRLSYIPAQEYSAVLEEDAAGSRAVATGRMRQGILFGENISMRRKIVCGCNEKSFTFTDTVTNDGFLKCQQMMLYHFNMGYPLLDESAELIIPFASVESRDAHAQTGFDEKLNIPKPIHGYAEMCYFYKLKHDAKNKTCVGIYNHNLDFGVAIHFDAALLDRFTQWKMVGEGEYALGLEPGNADPMGVAEELKKGHVKYLEPGESRAYEFRIHILDGKGDLKELRGFTDTL